MTSACAVTSPSTTSSRLSPSSEDHEHQRQAENYLSDQSAGSGIHVLSLEPSTRYAHIVSTNPSSQEPAEREIPPVDVDGVTAVALGSVAFAVALVACLIFRDKLMANGHPWWVWVCMTGVALGCGGLVYVMRRRTAYRAHRAKQ